MRQTTIRGIDDNRKVGTVKPSFSDVFMYTRLLDVYMAKLYWRIKKEGKWTWRSARVDDIDTAGGVPNWNWYLIQEEE